MIKIKNGKKAETIKNCAFCDEPLYEDGVYKTSMGDIVCKECYKCFEEELYKDDESTTCATGGIEGGAAV